MITYNHVALTYDVTGQVVSFWPPQAEVIAAGAPTAAATYSVWGGTQANDETAKFTGSATLDSVATTVDDIDCPLHPGEKAYVNGLKNHCGAH